MSKLLLKKLRQIIPALFLLSSISAFSQTTVKVEGTVTNNSDRQPVPYASVSMTSAADSKIVFGGMTDESGKFSIEVASGDYNVTVDQAGFETFYDIRSFSENTKGITVVLIPAMKEKELEGIVVQGTKPIYKVELDKKVYDVAQDLTARTGSLSDVLANVPSVSVDVDGTVNLRGNSNVKILIDGKPSAMLGITDTGDALKMIPADQVERIEVITNASARYEASGTAGIINIVTKKTQKRGITGSVQLQAGIPQSYGASVSLGYGKGNWSWFANAGFRYSKNKGKNNTDDTRYNAAAPSGIARHSIQKGESERERYGFNGNTGFNFDFDTQNSLTTSIGFRTNRGNSDNTKSYNDFIYYWEDPNHTGSFLSDANPDPIFTLRDENQHSSNHGFDGNMTYTHKFAKEGNTFTLDGNYNYSTDDSNSNIFDTDKGIQRTVGDNTQNSFTMKADYVLPFKEGSQFEAGARADYSKIKSNFVVDAFNSATDDWENLYDFTGVTDYESSVLAAYAQYGNTFGNFSFLAGLREETTYTKVNATGGISSSYNKTYTDLFPTLHLGYNLTKQSQLQFSYSRRIDRPRGRMLIPIFNYSDDRNTFRGNSNIMPNYTDSYELGYNLQKRNWGITPSVYYQRTHDVIQMYTSVDSLGNYSTMPVNVGYQDRFGGSLSYTFNPFKWWRMFGEFNFFSYKTVGQYEKDIFDKSDFSWNTRLNMTFKLPQSISAQVQGFYRGAMANGQNSSNGMLMLNLGLSKDVLNGQGTVLFNVRDILNSGTRKTKTHGTDNDGNDFYRYEEMQFRPRQFTLSFTYRFSKLPEDKKSKKQNNNSSEDSTDSIYGSDTSGIY
ncbi:MAG: TonB-dependent receptor [Flavobacteriaceae bacterium]|jgi:outer membrane receptor protein involved in Fe transport|nr:TonB-dependent receptor [Flavobacteriaceae bacterium]